MTESRAPGTGNQAPSLDQIDAEIAAEQARWDAEQAKAPPQEAPTIEDRWSCDRRV